METLGNLTLEGTGFGAGVGVMTGLGGWYSNSVSVNQMFMLTTILCNFRSQSRYTFDLGS